MYIKILNQKGVLMKFEYLIKTSRELYNASHDKETFDYSVELTKLGKDGWELVNSLLLPTDDRGFAPIMFFFKRAV